MTRDLDHAKHYAWNASRMPGHQPHVYEVQPTAEYGHRRDARGTGWASEAPLRIVGEARRHPQTVGQMRAQREAGE